MTAALMHKKTVNVYSSVFSRLQNCMTDSDGVFIADGIDCSMMMDSNWETAGAQARSSGSRH